MELISKLFIISFTCERIAALNQSSINRLSTMAIPSYSFPPVFLLKKNKKKTPKPDQKVHLCTLVFQEVVFRTISCEK